MFFDWIPALLTRAKDDSLKEQLEINKFMLKTRTELSKEDEGKYYSTMRKCRNCGSVQYLYIPKGIEQPPFPLSFKCSVCECQTGTR